MMIKQGSSDEVDPDVKDLTEGVKVKLGPSFALVALGSIVLVTGARLIVLGASEVAISFGISRMFVSLTVIAVGTSLPELAASAMAAKRGETDLCVGNVVGSNIFNLLLVLGFTAVVKPVVVSAQVLGREMIWALGLSVLLMVMAFFSNSKLKKEHGFVFLLSYCIFIYVCSS